MAVAEQATTKTKQEIAVEMVTAYRDEHPGTTVVQACKAIAEMENTTPGAVNQAYYAGLRKRAAANGDAPPPRKRRRRTELNGAGKARVATARAVRPESGMHDLLRQLDAAGAKVVEDLVNFRRLVSETNRTLIEHEKDLTTREQQVRRVEETIRTVIAGA